MPSARLKLPLIAAIAATAGLALLGWAQRWVTLELVDRAAPVEVGGGSASPAVGALALAALALVAALALAGPVFRVVLGLLGVLLGVLVAVFSVGTLVDPLAASAGEAAWATGVSGAEALAALIGTVAVSPWPAVSAVSGILLALASLAAAVTGPRWPGSGRRYQAVRFEGPSRDPDPVADWDRLTHGDDPTAP